jgi:nucleoside-diphosphate-sugar epimerase
MKILIIGGTGNLSTAIVLETLKKNNEVCMLNRGNHKELIPPGVRLLKADIYDKDLAFSLLKNIYFDVVIDFLCNTPENMEYHYNLFKNITNQYVFISTISVYDYNMYRNNYVCVEDSPKVSMVERGGRMNINKYLCEEYLIKNALQGGFNYTIIRPCGIYGKTRIPYYGIGAHYNYQWILLDRILNGKSIITWNNGENKCNTLYVDDFAIGLMDLLGNKLAYNEDFNLVGDECPSNRDILNLLSEILDTEVNTMDIPTEYLIKGLSGKLERELVTWYELNRMFSNEKIKSVAKNFKQTISIKSGLETIINFYKEHNFMDKRDYALDGNHDRIITQYLHKNNISTKNYKLYYIDYSMVRMRENKIKYLVYKIINPILLEYCFIPLKIMKKISRVFKNLKFHI